MGDDTQAGTNFSGEQCWGGLWSLLCPRGIQGWLATDTTVCAGLVHRASGLGGNKTPDSFTCHR